MSDHDLPGGGLDVRRGEALVDVAAVVVCERVGEAPRRPVLDGDDAPHAELLHQRVVVPQVQQRRPVERGPVVH